MTAKHSLAFLVFVWVTLSAPLAAQRGFPDKTKWTPRVLEKTAGSPSYTILNIGNLTSWVRYDGINFSPSSDNAVYFPAGTGNVIYKDGFVWGGKAYLDAAHSIPAANHVVRTGGAAYATGTRAGYVSGYGASAFPAPSSNPEVRVYRIRRDYFTQKSADGKFSNSLRNDAANLREIPSYYVTDAEVQNTFDQYEADWNQWPVQFGAPYIERNGIPGYQQPPPFSASFTPDSLIEGSYDEPGISGPDTESPADQVIWFVYNDLNVSTALNFADSDPLGLEIQRTVWSYDAPPPVANLYFSRYRIINKGGVDTSATPGFQGGAFYIDSMYVSQWSDPDIGSFSDDLVGCDTTLSLGFAYNANEVDPTFRIYSLAPPSPGYRFLQGPLVLSPGDTGIFDIRTRVGVRNLPMTSFSYLSANSPYGEFPGRLPSYNYDTGTWWKLLRGFAGTAFSSFDTPDLPYEHGPFPETKFPLSGDPLKGTGFLDGLGTNYSFVPGDRRLLLNSGPFTLSPGDTQEVVVAFVAGLGSDRLSSISVMKSVAKFSGRIYEASFSVPRAPTAPRAKVTELSGEVVLEWGSDLQRVKSTENNVIAGHYRFEGYSVYQLPSSNSALSEGTRIATFDLDNNVGTIVDFTYDSPSGDPVPVVVQAGSNSGIQRYLDIRQDYLSSSFREPLRNGKEYFFAVTAYNYAADPSVLPRSFESAPVIVRAVPRIPFGINTTAGNGDSVSVTRISGVSDGIVSALVVDPLASTGQTYQVRFDSSGVKTVWSLTNTTVGSTLLSQQAPDSSGVIVEGGIILKALNLTGLKPFSWTWSGSRFITWSGGADGLHFEEFYGAVGWASPYDIFGGGPRPVPSWRLHSIEIRFCPTSDSLGTFSPADPNASFAYRYGDNFDLAPAQPSFAPFIVNPSGGFTYQDFTVSVPLAVYDVDANPPRRLAVGFLENNAAGGAVNGKYWPPYYNDADNTNSSGPREWLFIFDADYSTSPDSLFTKDLISSPVPVMYWATWARRDNFAWPAGNSMRLTAYKPFSPGDVYTYTLPAVQTGTAVDKESVKRVGVFPNPYYAGRNQETTTWRHFVTFNNLPPNITIRIFNLAGHLVRTLRKNDLSQFLEWDLTNEDHWAVASGMYICYVEMPDIGATKVLKLAVIQPQNLSPY